MATSLQVGDHAPTFTLPDQDRKTCSLESFRGQVVVLAFYPLDFSGTCTREHARLTDAAGRWDELDAQVLGISIDHSAAHKAFATQQGIDYPLLADFHPKGEVGRRYGVYLEDVGFHARTTFIIDPEGRIAHVHEAAVPELPDVEAIIEAAHGARARSASA